MIVDHISAVALGWEEKDRTEMEERGKEKKKKKEKEEEKVRSVPCGFDNHSE